MRRHILALSCVLIPVALIACGSSGGGTGGSGGGTGGGGTTTASSSSSSTTTSSSSSTTTSSSSSGSAGNNCTNSADLSIIQSQDIPTIAGNCGKTNIATQDQIAPCIVDATKADGGTGLSDACAGCFADTVKCAISKCLTQCLSDSNSQACKDCRAQNCDPAFYACSGLPQQSPDGG